MSFKIILFGVLMAGLGYVFRVVSGSCLYNRMKESRDWWRDQYYRVAHELEKTTVRERRYEASSSCASYGGGECRLFKDLIPKKKLIKWALEQRLCSVNAQVKWNGVDRLTANFFRGEANALQLLITHLEERL